VILTSKATRPSRHNWRVLDALEIQQSVTYPRALEALLEDRIEDRHWKSRKRYITDIEGEVVRVKWCNEKV